MNPLKIHTSFEVDSVFKNYPRDVAVKMNYLRTMILDTARESDEINEITETLKWGEPSYLTKIGSTIRIDWKVKNPEQYAVYFKCTSKLVPSFKAVYGNLFKYEGNRAIIFNMNDTIPVSELKNCIASALSYHKVKHLQNLGLS